MENRNILIARVAGFQPLGYVAAGLCARLAVRVVENENNGDGNAGNGDSQNRDEDVHAASG